MDKWCLGSMGAAVHVSAKLANALAVGPLPRALTAQQGIVIRSGWCPAGWPAFSSWLLLEAEDRLLKRLLNAQMDSHSPNS